MTPRPVSQASEAAAEEPASHPGPRFPAVTLCACVKTCADVAEKDDHPQARCKGLPVDVTREASRDW